MGRVTRAGMRTAPNRRVIKADAPRRYRWVGRDNSALRAELEDELDGLRRQFDDVTRQVEIARGLVQAQQGRIDELNRLQDDLSWEDLDLEPTTRRLAALADELDQCRQSRTAGPPRRLRHRPAEALRGQEARPNRPSRTSNGSTGYGEPSCGPRMPRTTSSTRTSHSPRTSWQQPRPCRSKRPPWTRLTLAAVTSTRRPMPPCRPATWMPLSLLEDQIRADDAARANHERTLLAIIRAYRNINDRTHREIDDAIESLPALEQIHQQLVTDDLPRTRRDWLKKVDADLNQGLRALLQQIDVDRREITRGLDPINAVLAGVPFRHDSHLAIEPVDHPNSNLQEFRKVVLAFTRDNPLGEDLFNDETKVEASFRQLRKSLERLTDPSRAGESWRRSVFDAREHVTFRAIETPSSGKPIVHEGVSGMSGGEGQELIAFILGAALRYRLGEGGQTPPTYGCVVLDEGFVKADSDYTGRALRALQELGFQLIIGAPREKATAFEDFVDLVAYISTDPDNPDGVRIYSMTIQEALQLDQDAA